MLLSPLSRVDIASLISRVTQLNLLYPLQLQAIRLDARLFRQQSTLYLEAVATVRVITCM